MPDRVYIIDNRYYDAVYAAFAGNRTFLPSVTCHALAAPVSAHPDMVLFSAEKGTCICAAEVYSQYLKILSPFGVELVQGNASLGSDYPADIAYNVLNTRAGAFARFDSTDKHLTRLLDKKHIKKVNVGQGYARCSSVSFGDALISADPTIIKAGKEAGLSVLSITPGYVNLPGYDYGFIGGASGILGGDTVAFFGDLSYHPDGEKIRNFITANGFFVAEMPGQPLSDIGTIFCIEL
ncbi:MAG: hypothetical protein IKD21_00510 [Clostridia bacterium]|nr:hypothetical protein [Clostridia bacterium]